MEERFIAIGPIRRGLVLVVFTERSEDTAHNPSAIGCARRAGTGRAGLGESAATHEMCIFVGGYYPAAPDESITCLF